MAAENELESAVGQSFGIQDAPADAGSEQQGDEQQQESHEQQSDDGSSAEGEQSAGQQGAERDISDPNDPRYRDRGQLFDDKPRRGPRGELLDKAGNIVAGTRREKQLAYNLNRAQYAANVANRENRRLLQAMTQFNQLGEMVRRSNLTPQLVQEALELRARAEQDPINTVRDIVSRVLASGVTMDQIFGNDAVPNINANLIKNELDKRLGPLQRREEQAARSERINQRAAEQLDDFLFNHEHANVHGVEISQLVDAQQLSPERAYFELRSWAERRGMDFSQPLRPQVLAAMQQARGGGGRQQPQRRTTPAGARGNGQMETLERGTARGDFKSNAPWGAIARAVYTEINNK